MLNRDAIILLTDRTLAVLVLALLTRRSAKANRSLLLALASTTQKTSLLPKQQLLQLDSSRRPTSLLAPTCDKDRPLLVQQI